MRRELKRLKTYLGRVFRDVCRKIDGHLDLAARFSELLGLVERLLAQKPNDNNKLYSRHAPEVVCISKGKTHKRYEFGCKVGIAATNREGLFIAAMAFEGNPYDGHTLKVTAAKTEEMTDVAIERLYVDKGYRGHDYDGRLGRNYLLGTDGDKINALLAAAGHNLRLVLARLARLWVRFIRDIARLITKFGQMPTANPWCPILAFDYRRSKLQWLRRFSRQTR